jgi:thioester reductase-like protein
VVPIAFLTCEQAAWAVNFSIPLKSFVDEHLVGLHNILGLALSCSLPIQFTFCSSTASILGPFSSSCIEERISTAPSDAGATGYSKSKWVAEHICAAVAKKLNGSTNILRIGQLTGDTKHGVWNISEAWPLVLSTVDAIACLPELDENLSWLPLDTAATAIMEIATKAAKYEDQARVYHLVNTSSEATWSDLLTWSSEAILKPFDVVSPILWLDKLENFPKAHPAKGLLGFWRSAYGNSSLSHGGNDTPVFSIVEAQNKSTVMRCIPPVDKQLIAKIWCWLEEEITTAKE